MTAERWQQIKSVFETVDSAPPDERETLLDQLCQTDADLRQHVQNLLAEQLTGTFIQRAIGEQAASLHAASPTQERFGHYQLGRRLGQGGMGAVFEATRVDDFHKKVALKIIKQEFDSDFARTRFQQERQLLASLEHPNIARLLDGGESNAGSPYLVLEFVDGVTIDKFCQSLDRQTRLRLFLKVCAAVEYAHRNLIIHRDLKPANILVSRDGEPKLLDFGIAKLLDPSANATQTAIQALTPDYASPEQVRGLPISTASDVYSLGVVLYQLLTDRRPYQVTNLTALEMDRVIAERPPDPPQLKDELDNILLMALRKEPERRYGSALEFAQDIERYLDHRPVAARQDTRFYRVSKFVRRNRLALAGTTLALLAITVFAIGALRASWRADAEAAAAREINSFLENDLLAQASSYSQPDPNITVKTALDRAAQSVGQRFVKQPSIEASLRRSLSKTYIELGLYPEARRQMERTIEIDLRQLGPTHRLTLADQSQLGRIDFFEAKFPQSETQLRSVLAKQQRLFSATDPDLLDTMDHLGSTYVALGKHADAEKILQSVADLRTRRDGPESAALLTTLGNLAGVYYLTGRSQQAAELGEKVVGLNTRVYGREHPETLAARNNLANVYMKLGKFQQGETIYREVLEIKRHTLGPEHPDTLVGINNVAYALMFEGKFRESADVNRSLLDTRLRLLPADNIESLTTMHNLAAAYHAIGEDGLAIPLETEAVERRRRVLGPSHLYTLMSMDQLAAEYAAVGREREAEALELAVLERQQQSLGPNHPEHFVSMARLANLYRRQQKYAAAERLQQEAAEGFEKTVGSQHPNFLTAQVSLALYRLLLHRQDASAEVLLRPVLAVYRDRFASNWQRYRCESVLGEALALAGKAAEAEPLLASGYRGMLEQKTTVPADFLYNIENAAHWLDALHHVPAGASPTSRSTQARLPVNRRN